MDKLTINQAKQLNDSEIEIYLKKIWGIKENKSIEVIGELAYISTQYRLKNLTLTNGKNIEYPLEDINSK